MRTLITNGTIVTAEGSTAADVLIDGETIAALGTGLAEAGMTADETIDASGRYVIPELPAMNGARARTRPMNLPTRIVRPP